MTTNNANFSTNTTWSNSGNSTSITAPYDTKSVVTPGYDCGKNFDSGTSNGVFGFNALTPVLYAQSHGMGSVNLVLTATGSAESSGDNTSWQKFTNNPHLNITYNTPPTTPTKLSVRPCYQVCTGNVVSNPTASAPLTLTAAASDADGGNIYYLFRLFKGHGAATSGSEYRDYPHP